jgi:hypothetical protein
MAALPVPPLACVLFNPSNCLTSSGAFPPPTKLGEALDGVFVCTPGTAVGAAVRALSL